MLKICELLGIFVILPSFFWLGILPKSLVFPTLWVVCIYSFYHLYQNKIPIFAPFSLKEFKFILARFAFFATLIAIFTAIYDPNLLFLFPRTNFKMWLVVIALYPLLSAFLQEVVFRAFFTLRYRKLFNHAYSFVIINAAIFAGVHILFGNFIAVTFTFLGGVLFARSYLKTRSTLLCAIEHSLYGDFIFTIGLGKFFYHGA